MAESLRKGLPPAVFRPRIQREFFRPASAARPSRGAGRSRPLLFLLRRALHERLPDVDRHPALHPPDLTGNPLGSAKTIFDQNILGGMCARVCPTETLCEEACVRETAEGKPVQIGRLQRYATDMRDGAKQAVLQAR